jgi:hypothetical protein
MCSGTSYGGNLHVMCEAVHMNSRTSRMLCVVIGSLIVLSFDSFIHVFNNMFGKLLNDEYLFCLHCCTGAVSLTPAVAPAVATVAQIQPKSMNGKRKLPGPAGIAVGPRSPSGAIAASASGFAQEKRACRPGAALQKGSSDFQLNNHMGLAG